MGMSTCRARKIENFIKHHKSSSVSSSPSERLLLIFCPACMVQSVNSDSSDPFLSSHSSLPLGSWCLCSMSSFKRDMDLDPVFLFLLLPTFARPFYGRVSPQLPLEPIKELSSKEQLSHSSTSY